MILIDRALQERAREGRPVRVGLVGAGYAATAIARQIVTATPGMDLVAIANRHPERARGAFEGAGIDEVGLASAPSDVDAGSGSTPVISDDPTALTESDSLDVIVEATGAVSFGAEVALSALRHGRHLVLVNAELDATVGPQLAQLARRSRLVYSAADGDQPGTEMNLYRFVTGIGAVPLVCGNIKGLYDPHRTPTTQQQFAEAWGQNPRMATSFADGTKLACEQAIVANGTGMTVARRGMGGFDHPDRIETVSRHYDVDELEELGGVVDFVIGADPAPGVFVVATVPDPAQREYLRLYKMGDGPLYVFHRPYHLCHFEVPASIARATIFGDATLEPRPHPSVDVIAVAKRPLDVGQTIDGIGGYDVYGLAERYESSVQTGLLPIGLAEGCVVRRPIAKDEPVTREDVQVPENRPVDVLRAQQDAAFVIDRDDGSRPGPADAATRARPQSG